MCDGPHTRSDFFADSMAGILHLLADATPRYSPLTAANNPLRTQGEETMSRPRAAGDFVAIRARLEELRFERERARQQPWLEQTGLSHRLLPPISRVPIRTGPPSGPGPLRGGRGG